MFLFNKTSDYAVDLYIHRYTEHDNIKIHKNNSPHKNISNTKKWSILWRITRRAPIIWRVLWNTGGIAYPTNNNKQNNVRNKSYQNTKGR